MSALLFAVGMFAVGAVILMFGFKLMPPLPKPQWSDAGPGLLILGGALIFTGGALLAKGLLP